jgi:hypothetical protein
MESSRPQNSEWTIYNQQYNAAMLVCLIGSILLLAVLIAAPFCPDLRLAACAAFAGLIFCIGVGISAFVSKRDYKAMLSQDYEGLF